MRPELNLNYEEKIKISEWKHLLPKKERKFIYAFTENGKYTSDGYKLYDYVIHSDDDFSIVVSEDIELC